MLQKFWYDRTIRTQLLIAIGAINLCAVLIACAVSILNARDATRVEMEASLEIAKQFARVTIQSLAPDGEVGDLSKKINQLSSRLQLARLRHVRIFMADATGNLVQLSPQEPASSPPQQSTAPRWFAALVEPEVAPQELSVVLANPGASAVLIVEHPVNKVPKVWSLGTVVVAGEPADEIAEVWQDISSLTTIWLVLDVLVLAVLYLVLFRLLDPLANLARSLLKLEDGQYLTRLQPPNVKELAVIGERFNGLAEALDRSRAENAQLYGQLITVQEDERREVANELHDEASPCLFGIMANTLSVQRLAGRRHDRKTREIQGHVSEILRITDHLNSANRALLKKLRPVVLGRVALSDVVSDLVRGLQRRHPDVTLSPSAKICAASYGEAIDLTIYRCIQEGVTNAIRHGKATSILIELFDTRPSCGVQDVATCPTLQLTIQDDGRGILADTQIGFGIKVMRERVQALGGTCAIQSAPSHGTNLRVIIPISAAAGQNTHAMEMAQAS